MFNKCLLITDFYIFKNPIFRYFDSLKKIKAGSIEKIIIIYRNRCLEFGCFCKIKYLSPFGIWEWSFCLVSVPENLFAVLFIYNFSLPLKKDYDSYNKKYI